MNNKSKVLILAPHTDDGEIGCGGTISMLCRHGLEIYYVAFSAAEKSVGKEWPRDILYSEVKKAVYRLGLKDENLTVLDFEVREFPRFRQEILEKMIDFDRKINPDIVFLPSTLDTHQDHQVISQEGFRAFKRKTILGYELLWNNLTFTTSSFFVLDEQDIKRKIEAVKCYKSQRNRYKNLPDTLKKLAELRGQQIKEKYAEAYEVIRIVTRTSSIIF